MINDPATEEPPLNFSLVSERSGRCPSLSLSFPLSPNFLISFRSTYLVWSSPPRRNDDKRLRRGVDVYVERVETQLPKLSLGALLTSQRFYWTPCSETCILINSITGVSPGQQRKLLF